MSFRRMAVGSADSSSATNDPVISTTDNHVFTINPTVMNQQFVGGQLVRTLSGSPRVTTTQTPLETFALRWSKIPATTKKDELDRYFNRNTKLVFINDQNYAWEVIVVPGSYRANRRRSTKDEPESYDCEITLSSLGEGKQLTDSDTGYVALMG